MTLYEIINLSDPYTIEAESMDVALMACVMLGGGQYAFKPIEDCCHLEIPFFMFGGLDDWCLKYLGAEWRDVLARVTTDPAKRAELADCFESCMIGKPEERKLYYATLEKIDVGKRQAWISEWHDYHRSSKNDIGARARAMAAKLRAGASDPAVPAPQQVFTS